MPILLEDDALIALDKPAGLAVHGGSGIQAGLIEQLRASRPQAPFLELVHRLDRDTSGILLVAKQRKALVALHRALAEGRVHKRYVALVKGYWGRAPSTTLRFPLHRYVAADGERRVRVQPEARPPVPGSTSSGTSTCSGLAGLSALAEPAGMRAPHRPHPPDPGAPGASRLSDPGRPEVR